MIEVLLLEFKVQNQAHYQFVMIRNDKDGSAIGFKLVFLLLLLLLLRLLKLYDMSLLWLIPVVGVVCCVVCVLKTEKKIQTECEVKKLSLSKIPT